MVLILGICSLLFALANNNAGPDAWAGAWVGARYFLLVVMGVLLPVVLRRYRQADERRLEAEEFRRSTA